MNNVQSKENYSGIFQEGIPQNNLAETESITKIAKQYKYFPYRRHTILVVGLQKSNFMIIILLQAQQYCFFCQQFLSEEATLAF